MQIENVENLLLKKQLSETTQQLKRVENEMSVLKQQNAMLKQEPKLTPRIDHDHNWVVIMIIISVITLLYINNSYAYVPELTLKNIKRKFNGS